MNSAMAQQIFVEGQAAAENTEDILKKRTLLIGIGGSGKEVVMRFRRKLNEMYDGLDKHPYIEYIWLDTDSRNKNIRNVDWDKSFNDTKMEGPNIINASMSSNELQSFYDNFDQYHNYHHWFNFEALRGMGSQVLVQGASAMRPFGKLAFWKHSTKIENAISGAITRLKSPGFSIKNLSSADDIDVYVIASLAGGTGSGMLIDTAVMLQKIDFNLNLNGIFFLSDIFANDRANPVGGNQIARDANCFAALQELDFYMTPENQTVRDKNPSLFDFNWSDSQQHTIMLPIFTKLNLVSNIYQNNEVEPSLEEAFNIVAEYLIMGYNDTSFDADIRSARTNVIRGYNQKMQFMNVIRTSNKPYRVTTPYSTTYTGLGLGLIEFNKKRIKNWAKYQFLADFLNGLASQNRVDRTLFIDEHDKPKTEYLDPDTIWNRLEAGGKGESPIDEMMSKMREERNQLLETILNWSDIRNVNIDKMQSMRTEIERTISQFFDEKRKSMLRETRDDGNHRGQIIKTLNDYKDIVFSAVPKEIRRQYYRILTATNKDGISSAGGFIDEVGLNISTTLNNYLSEKKPVEQIYRAPGEFELPDMELVEKINKYAQDAEDIPKTFFGYGTKAKRFYESERNKARESYKNSLRQSIQSYVAEHEKHLKEVLENNYYTILSDNFKKVIEIISSTIESLSNNDHFSITENLKNWARNYEQYSRAFEFQEINVAQRKLVLDKYLETDIIREYEDIVKAEAEENYQNFLQILRKYLSDSLTALLVEEDIGQSSEMFFVYALANHQAILQNKKIDLFDLLEKCATMFIEDKEFLGDKTVISELLRLLNNEATAAGVELGIKKAYEQSCMRLNFIHHSTLRENMEREFIAKNGISANNSQPLIDRLNRILGSDVGFNLSNMDEEIVFYQEGSGFPLVALQQINDLRGEFYKDIRTDPNKIYQRYTTKDYEYLRTLKNMNDAEFNQFSRYYRDAMKAVMLGIVKYEKKVFDNGQSEWRFKYSYMDRGVRSNTDMLKQIESVADVMSTPTFSETYDRIVGESNLNELTVVNLVKLIGAITINLNLFGGSVTAGKPLTMGQWALMEIREMVEAQLRQKMKDEYPDKDALDKFINKLYPDERSVEDKYKKEDYNHLQYYTSEFQRGIYVMPRN